MEDLILTKLDSLNPIEISSVLSILVRGKIDNEALYHKIARHIFEHSEKCSMRMLSNALNSMGVINYRKLGFNQFFQEMKPVIWKKMKTESVNARDLMGVLVSYSKSYNHSENFLQMLETKALDLFSKKKFSPRQVSDLFHSFSLNKSIYDAHNLFSALNLYFLERPTSFSLKDTLLVL